MKGNAETGAMIRSTVALTKLEGSDTINVIPNKPELFSAKAFKKEAQ